MHFKHVIAILKKCCMHSKAKFYANRKECQSNSEALLLLNVFITSPGVFMSGQALIMSEQAPTDSNLTEGNCS